jgi:hypothetical protein
MQFELVQLLIKQFPPIKEYPGLQVLQLLLLVQLRHAKGQLGTQLN